MFGPGMKQDPEAGAVIIGAGGTAASVASWLIRRMPWRFPIRIVGREATLFTRSAGYFEDRFGDDDAWAVLDNEARRKLVDRLTRGVVWQDVIELLGDADDLVSLRATLRGSSFGTTRRCFGCRDRTVRTTICLEPCSSTAAVSWLGGSLTCSLPPILLWRCSWPTPHS